MAELINQNTENTNTQGQGTEPETEHTYTEKEFQAEIDRRVSQALATQQRKNDAKMREAEKLAGMNAEQKYQYELEQREKAIEEKEKQLLMAENKNAASKILSEKGLSLSLLDLIVAEDADTMHKNINLLDKAFRASVKTEVEKRLGSSGATRTAPPDANNMTPEEFKKLPLREKQKIYETDRELYNSLTLSK